MQKCNRWLVITVIAMFLFIVSDKNGEPVVPEQSQTEESTKQPSQTVQPGITPQRSEPWEELSSRQNRTPKGSLPSREPISPYRTYEPPVSHQPQYSRQESYQFPPLDRQPAPRERYQPTYPATPGIDAYSPSPDYRDYQNRNLTQTPDDRTNQFRSPQQNRRPKRWTGNFPQIQDSRSTPPWQGGDSYSQWQFHSQ